ncbi:MAG: hypothetical protein HOK57_00965 [Planctomycetaceae bacterium]|nr:hypothetical protein [Planctomycetaceae bacterium]MBT6642487.1 hypothetical protein [Planctomycetaceae bacterium]MBT6918240.1 hypothetical protein [Planctomycetaceae bacterium]MBT7728953.1 hypothetical protein [Planctomycetaceae bacterium]
MDPHQAEGIAAITAIHDFYGEVTCLRARKFFKSRVPKDSVMNRIKRVSCERSTTAENLNRHSDLELQRAAA